jgi:hypothetical protein
MGTTKKIQVLRCGVDWEISFALQDYTTVIVDPLTASVDLCFRSQTNFFDIHCTISEDQQVSTLVLAEDTATFTPDLYNEIWYLTYVEADTFVQRKECLLTQQRKLLPDASVAGALDLRTTARKLLDAINNHLLNRASSDEMDLITAQFGDRVLTRDRSALMDWRRLLQIEVEREQGRGKIRGIQINLTQ